MVAIHARDGRGPPPPRRQMFRLGVTDGGDCVSVAFGDVWLSNNQFENDWGIAPGPG